MKIQKMKIPTILGALLVAGTLSAGAQMNSDSLYKEPYRPQYHFSPEKGWIGDPSGFMYYQGKYHMYWWGKVESTDLVHYQQITPYAMTGADDNISYFTGSAVVDKNNTAGFGKGAYVAAYTVFEKDSKKQVMAVAKALEKKIKFYTSPDLKNWTWTSDFGPAGDSEKSWECPDLFQLPVDGNSDKKRWVMVVSVNWAQEQYFIGDFDGTSFKLMENHPAEPLYVDKGLDFYASRTFQDFDGTLDSKISMGWVATWDYAPVAPSRYGKGFWSIPRNLELKTYKEGVRLVQKPVEQLQTLRHKPASVKRALSVGTQRLPGFVPDENVYELDASFSTDVSNTFGLNLCVGEGRKVVVSYDTDSHNLVIDRTHCSDVQIPKFSRMAYARVEPVDNKIHLHIFVDKSSIEIFANDGKDVFTLLTYPGEAQPGIELFAQKKGTKMELDAWMLKSIWR